MDNLFYKKLIKELPIGYAYHKTICNSDGTPIDYEFLEVNEAFEKFTGLVGKDIIGKTICEIIPEIKKDSFDWIGKYGKISLDIGEGNFEQYSIPLKKWYRVDVKSFEKGYFTTYFTDITKEKMQINEHKMLIVALNEAVFELNEFFVFVNVISPNDNFLFLPIEQIIGKSVFDLLPDELVDIFKEGFKEAKKIGKKEIVEFPLMLEDDNKWFNANIAFVEINEKNMFVVKIKDITASKRVDQALISLNATLENSDEIWFSLIDLMPDLVFYKSSELIYLGCNKAFAEFVGKTKNEIIGKTDFEIFDKKTALLVRNTDTKLINTGYSRIKEEMISCFNNKEIYLETLRAPYLDKSGNVIGLLAISRDISGRKQYEQQLLDTTEELERFFTVNLDLLCIVDADGNFVKANKAWQTTLGYSTKYLQGKKITEFIHPDDIEATLVAMSKLRDQEQVINFVNRYKTKRGDYKYIEWRSHPYGNYIYAAARDITQRKQMEDYLFLQKERLQTTLLSIGDGVISVDKDQKIVFTNKVAQKMTGWSQKQSTGKMFSEVFNIINEKTREKADNPIDKVLKTGKITTLSSNTLLISKNGDRHAVEDSAAPIKDRQGIIQGAVIVFRDVSEKRRIRNEIEYLSFHDFLTGLYNRRFYEEELSRLDVIRNLPLSVIMLDVNGLKLTNDAFGHEAGDALLKKVADIIKKSCREDDIVARTGGDEFSVILPKTDEIEAELICRRLVENAAKETIDSVIVSVAVGYYTKNKHSEEINDIIKAAENCMYSNKIRTSREMRNQTIQKIIENLCTQYANEQVHIERTRKVAHHIGLAMNMLPEELKTLENAAYLHDVGKVMLPPEVLNKTGKLTKDEYEQVKRHSEAGYQILKSVEEYSGLSEYVLCHHERWDGGGYPRQLKGDDIPLISRIIAVSDAFEAMTAGRPYQKALNKQQTINELKKHSGTQFDPYVVDVFINKVLNYKDNEELMTVKQ